MARFRSSGLIVISLAVVLPLMWFVPLASERDPLALVSQYFGAAALILMSLSQLMATRLPGVEKVFGGLDQVYVLHKWVGIAALALVLLHDTIDADMRGLGDDSLLEELAETLGESSLYGFLVLIVLSVATFVPYRLWYRTHQFIGALFALSAFHFLFIAKPFAIGDPPGLYVGAFCLLGVTCYACTLLPIRRVARDRAYEVESVGPTGSAVTLSMKPLSRHLRHRPGQFAFLRFDLPGLKQAHPFTVSSAPQADGKLRFSIKASGEWTSALSNTLSVGTSAFVEGPYGHFTLPKHAEPTVWIAGGIGITPFLAWAEALAPDASPVHLFYCVRTKAEAPHLDQLTAIAGEKSALHLHLIESTVTGRLDPATIVQASGANLPRTHVYFCGPIAMRDSLQQGLSALGLRPSRFHFEHFEIRSGIGVRKFAEALLEIVLRKTRKVPNV
jgi:predicted ferric reductase